MTNGDTIHEIKALLADGKALSTKTALRLTLELQSQVYDMLMKSQAQQEATEKRVEKLEGNSIILWIQRHPKLTLGIATLYLTLTASIDYHDMAKQVLELIKSWI